MDSRRSQLGKLAPPGAAAVASTPPPPAPETLRSEGDASGANCSGSDAAPHSSVSNSSGSSGAGSMSGGASPADIAKGEAMLKSLSTNLVPELRRYVAVHRLEIERLVKD